MTWYKCEDCEEYSNDIGIENTTHGDYYGADDPMGTPLQILFCNNCLSENIRKVKINEMEEIEND